MERKVQKGEASKIVGEVIGVGKRAMVAARMIPLYEDEARKRMTAGYNQYNSPPPNLEEGSTKGETAKIVSTRIGVGKTQVYERR